MFKKLALVAACFICSNASANMEIIVGRTPISAIANIVEQTQEAPSFKPIIGYEEQSLRRETFSFNGIAALYASAIINSDGLIEGIRLKYSSGIFNSLIAELDRMYKKTFTRQFYDISEVEYVYKNSFIRVVKLGSETIVTYGTGRLFRALDEQRGQAEEIMQIRKNYAKHHGYNMFPQCKHEMRHRPTGLHHLQPDHEQFGPRIKNKAEEQAPIAEDTNDPDIQVEINDPDSVFQEHYPKNEHSLFNPKNFFKNFFGGFDIFENFGKEFRKNFVNKEKLDSKDGNVKTYRTEKRYSKVGDTEEWYDDDNGNITQVKKTPEGTTITKTDRNGEVQKIHKGPGERVLIDDNSNETGLVVL